MAATSQHVDGYQGAEAWNERHSMVGGGRHVPSPPPPPPPPAERRGLGGEGPAPESGTTRAAMGWGALSVLFGALVLIGSAVPWYAGSTFSVTDDLGSAWPIIVTGLVAVLGGIDGLRGSLAGPALAGGIGSVFALHQTGRLRVLVEATGTTIGAGGVIWTVGAVAAVALLIAVVALLARDGATGSVPGWVGAAVLAGAGLWVVGMILPTVPGEPIGDHLRYGLFGGDAFSDVLTAAFIGVPVVLAVAAASTRRGAAYGLAAGCAVFWVAAAVTSAADEGSLGYGFGRFTPILLGALTVAVTGCLAILIPPHRPATGSSMRSATGAVPVAAAAGAVLLPVAGIAGLVLDATDPGAVPLPPLADSGSGDDEAGTGGAVDVVCTDLVDSAIDAAWQDVDGAIHVTILVDNGCDVAQQLDDPSASFTLTGDGATVADATFDFSRSPIVVPAHGTRGGELVFGPETFVDLEAVETLGLGDAGTPSRGSLGIAYSYVCTDVPEGMSASGEVEVAGVPTGAPVPPSAPDEGGALARLGAISDADRPFVEAEVIDVWVPQISSKKPGVVLPNGTTWDAVSILEDHRLWREQFPRVRLLWSGDYSTFEASDFWVTIVAIPFATPEEANGWCDAQGLPAEDCFAKLISHTRGPAGSTALR